MTVTPAAGRSVGTAPWLKILACVELLLAALLTFGALRSLWDILFGPSNPIEAADAWSLPVLMITAPIAASLWLTGAALLRNWRTRWVLHAIPPVLILATWLILIGLDRGMLGATVSAASAQSEKQSCFTIQASANSAGTIQLFSSRQCQSGGVTWSAILHSLAAHQGRVGNPLNPAPNGAVGYARSIQIRGTTTWYSVDDEADAALLCAGDAALLKSIVDHYQRLNASRELLSKEMQQIPAEQMECRR